MSNMHVLQVARNQRILILDTWIQLDLYHNRHAHMHKYTFISVPTCIQLRSRIVHLSLWIQLVLETLHISLALVCHSSCWLHGHLYL